MWKVLCGKQTLCNFYDKRCHKSLDAHASLKYLKSNFNFNYQHLIKAMLRMLFLGESQGKE